MTLNACLHYQEAPRGPNSCEAIFPLQVKLLHLKWNLEQQPFSLSQDYLDSLNYLQHDQSWSYRCHSFSISLQFEHQRHVNSLVLQHQDLHLRYLLAQDHSVIRSLKVVSLVIAVVLAEADLVLSFMS